MYLEARARELEDLHKLVFLQKKTKVTTAKNLHTQYVIKQLQDVIIENYCKR